MKRTLFITLAALWVLAAPVYAAPPSKTIEDAKTFLALVRQNFAVWDYEHKGTLSREALEIDMQKPAIKGDAAAALAALKWGLQSKDPKTPDELKWLAGVTLADLDATETTLAERGKVENRVFNSAVFHFARGRDILAAQSRALFAFGGVPHLAAIRQTWDSDCYFNSGLGSIALERPQDVARLIKPNVDGTFTVSFPGKPSQAIPAPTDAEIAAYTDANDGVWYNVLEKAYGLIRIIKLADPTAEPLDRAAQHGGSPPEVMRLVTGHAIKTTPLHKRGDPGYADDKFLDLVRAELSAAFREHRGVTTDAHSHAYVVAAYDTRTDTVTIHNPWDQNNAELLVNGDVGVTFSGYTSMSTRRFVDNFGQIHVEQSTAAK